MTDLTLPPDPGEILDRAAKSAGTTPANLACRAIQTYLEEMADAKAMRGGRRCVGTLPARA